MNIEIHPGKLSGCVEIPSSKSYAHRLLIAAALADAPTEVRMNALNDDIIATANCLCNLGAEIMQTDAGFLVHPIKTTAENAILFCCESGSTLRFLLPVAAALGVNCTFTGAGRLPERPNQILTDALNNHGIQVTNDLLPMSIKGALSGGSYPIAGNVSSQYITGLLLALPLCRQDSEIILTTPLESAAYIDITLETLKPFGIHIESTQSGWHIPGNQRYRSPGSVTAEGDWSGAAFWLVANKLGSSISCQNLNETSCQGDRSITELLNHLGETIDISATPDLAPTLAVAAAFHSGTTAITGAARLRLKESDRIRAIADMLHALGVQAEEQHDGIVIHGSSRLSGGKVNGCNDHRIVMAAAIAATIADSPVVITDAQAINKSYPAFFDTFHALGGLAYVESDR